MDNGIITNEKNGAQGASANREVSSGHKRSPSGGTLSKLSFLRASAEDDQQANGQSGSESFPGYEPTSPRKTGRAMAIAVQQHKTRRRRGSLRKAALLGRGAQRERKELEVSPLNMNVPPDIYGADGSGSPTERFLPVQGQDVSLDLSDVTPRPSMDGYANRIDNNISPPYPSPSPSPGDALTRSQTTSTSPAPTYASTTDDEDILSIPKHLSALHNGVPLSSGSDSYFPHGSSSSLNRRRSTQKPSSPLSLGLSTNPLPVPDADWDYSETEWWGWVVLIVTWIVFVTGMGSCLGVWSWAWDVGETPYAPPELEDDPTLPIVGYYPALIILTAVMAWVWVVVAWVGMKYFRHAKITGD
jgi:Phosphatidylinositol N-acetylglucosaminyltransferase subunit Y